MLLSVRWLLSHSRSLRREDRNSAVSLSSAEISLFFSTGTRDLLLHLRMLTKITAFCHSYYTITSLNPFPFNKDK